MPDDSLQALSAALSKAATQGPVTLDAAFLTSAGIAPPDQFDSNLQAAFRLAAGTGLQLTFQPGDITPVSNRQFQVANAQLTLGYLAAKAAQTQVTLTFSLPDTVLGVQIEALMQSWKFTDFFTFMTGWPFDQLVITQPTFIFSTVSNPSYNWNGVATGGTAIALAPPLTFAANWTVPTNDSTAAVFAVVENLGVIPSRLTLSGPISVDKADNESILYPDMDLRAVLSTGTVNILGQSFLTASSPFLGYQISTEVVPPSNDDDEEEDDELFAWQTALGSSQLPADETEYAQTPSLVFGMKFALTASNGDTVLLDVRARVPKAVTSYSFSMMVDENSPVALTPQAVIVLMAGNSYFQNVPLQLQQFLTLISLNGLTITGPLKKPSIASLGMSFGSQPGTQLVLFSDASNNQQFVIEGFDVNWTLLNPLNAKTRKSLINISTEFKLWPSVFKDSNFFVSIDQDFNIVGKYPGTVALGDILSGLTMGAIAMPQGVSIAFSDVILNLMPSSKTYSLAFTVDAEVDFVTYNSKPLIQFVGLRFELSATTPTNVSKPGAAQFTAGAASATVYAGSMTGVIVVGPVAANTSVSYDGASSTWKLHADLAQPLSLTDLINQFFRAFTLPLFVPGDLTITTLSLDATIPSKGTAIGTLAAAGGDAQSTYAVEVGIVWKTDAIPAFGSLVQGIDADLSLQYDPSRGVGNEFSGAIIGSTTVSVFGLSQTINIGYSFGKTSSDAAELMKAGFRVEAALLAADDSDSSTLWIEWEGARATYNFADQTITFTLNGWTVGKLIQSLMKTLGDPYFTLDAPWDFLNSISLDGLSLTLDLKPNSAEPVMATYSLPSSIDLGFLVLRGITFRRVSGAVTLMLDAEVRVPGLGSDPLFGTGADNKGQDVKKMPAVPGKGSDLFELDLLAMGQHIAIYQAGDFTTTQGVINALAAVPATDDSQDTNPLNPGQMVKGQPYYNQSNGWLVATHFSVLGGTVDLMFVFNDPDLYGLRLALAGDKAKALAGLEIDVLYKKISDEIGVYQILFNFPNSLRNLDFGAYSITLPEIGLQIYTNGDFLIDFGFPYNGDFSRSFTVQAIVMGVPVIGSAGFYFGKVPAATVKQLPVSSLGTFDPVIVFGFGAQIGVGKTIDKGILKAGLSLTVYGIIEGIFAAWHAYQPADQGSGSLNDDYFYLLSGTFGIVGKLYGEVNFAIVSASVNVEIRLQAQIVFEAHKAIPLSASASVSVSVSLKIDLGLFSISINFSFSTTINVQLTLGSDSHAPWDQPAASQMRITRAQRVAPALTRKSIAMASLLQPLNLKFKPESAVPAPVTRGTAPAASFAAVVAADPKPTLTIYTTPQFTVTAPEGASALSEQTGAFVLLLTMTAPDVSTPNTRATDFEALCGKLLPWVIDAAINAQDGGLNIADTLDEQVCRVQLEDLLVKLSETTTSGSAGRPISAPDILTFLQSAFSINITPLDSTLPPAQQAAAQAGMVLFPAFTGFTLTVPNASGTGSSDIDLATYTTINDTYRNAIAQAFAQLAANVESESTGNASALAALAAADAPEAFAQFIFEDYFVLIARQLVQYAIDGMDDYDYELTPQDATPRDSIQKILDWAQAYSTVYQGVTTDNSHLTPLDIAQPNIQQPLSPGISLTLSGLSYVIQQDDTVTAVAARYLLDPAQIILTNQAFSPMIGSGVVITMSTVTASCVTMPGDSWTDIAACLSHSANKTITVEQVAADPAVQSLASLLVPAVSISLPDIAYKTPVSGTADTLDSLSKRFNLPLASLVNANLDVDYLFLVDADHTSIRIANLNVLPVSCLWGDISRQEKIGQLAGMTSRYMLHGMRLPVMPGLSLSSSFLYPTTGQNSYGMYQLSGQQFPAPVFGDSPAYSISVAKADSLSWITFVSGGNPQPTLTLQWNDQAERLKAVLAYAQTTGYDPQTTLDIQDGAKLHAAQYAMRSVTPWTTADLGSLALVTGAPPPGGTAPQITPLLWSLPEGLQQQLEQRQATLMSRPGVTMAQIVPFLPVLQPQAGRTDPATHLTSFTDLTDFAFATRIDLQVNKLAQNTDALQNRPNANNVTPQGPGNAGTPNQPLAPFTYELIGPSPAEAILLERLISALDAKTGLGGGMVNGMFLLYASADQGTQGMVSLDQEAFLSFIIQTNLSTETNPAVEMAPAIMMAAVAAEPAPPTGIANTPAEFVKLLWELSTVRSGGYYLYFEQLAAKLGLPDSLFDSSGHAKLTLVITYDRSSQGVLGAHVTNFVNAMVTTQAIDRTQAVVTLESRPSPASSLPLLAGDTLSSIAGYYGIGVGALAALNAGTPLALNTLVPVQGACHQVTLDDVKNGALAAVARYYSRHAQTPITTDALQAHNPGVVPALYTVLRIPPLNYQVADDAAGPGRTFSSMAAYYNLPGSAIACSAGGVPNLFAAQGITVDSQSFDLQAQLGNGNIGVDLTRVDLGPPPDFTPANSTPYAQAVLCSLYQLIRAGFYSNAFFKPSTMGLPFGPTRTNTPAQSEMLRRPQTRRLAFQAADGPAPFQYSQVLGVGCFATVDPCKSADPTVTNPYAGVGTIAQVNLEWLDLFGNSTVTPFNTPSAAGPGPLNNAPVPVLYVDRLIGLSQWPNVVVNYVYAGTAAQPVLQIQFALDTKPYDNFQPPIPPNPPNTPYHDGTAIAASDYPLFERVNFQLNQVYDQGIPGLTGNAVTVSLSNSLLAVPDIVSTPTGIDFAQTLREFAADCLTYIGKRKQGSPGGTAPAATMSLPLWSDVKAENIIELDLTLTLARQPGLCDPGLRGISGGTLSTTTIAPFTSDPAAGTAGNGGASSKVSLTAFATAFEGIFVTNDWAFRVGTGANDPASPKNNHSYSVWAVRFAQATGKPGLNFSFQNTPLYYAPKPVAQSLITGQAPIQTYQTGTGLNPVPITLTYTGVDLNVWVRQALSAIDTFLAPPTSAPAFIVDQLQSQTDFLAEILSQKQSLAESISSTVDLILVNGGGEASDATKSTAQDKYLQALENQLTAAYTINAAVVAPVIDAAYTIPLQPGTVCPPRFYGQPSATGQQNTNYALSTGKIQLVQDASGASQLAFLFSTRDPASNSDASLDLDYVVTHIEHQINNVPGIDGYEQSSWIAFVTGPINKPISSQALDIPIPLRTLPTPPTVTAQTALAASTDDTLPPNQLAQWDYGFNFQLNQSASQDSVVATAEFNQPPGPAALADALDPAVILFQKLAQFIAVYADIKQDFDTYLSKVTGGSRSTDTEVVNAIVALTAFNTIVQGVAQAYEQWAKPPVSLSATPAPAQLSYAFELRLTKYTPQPPASLADLALIQVIDTSKPDALPDPLVCLGDPTILIPVKVDVPFHDENVRVSYLYQTDPKDINTAISYEQALTITERIILFSGLDLFGFQSAWSSLRITRNKFLVEDGTPTNPVFEFHTPDVAFASPITPLLVVPAYDLATLSGLPPKPALVDYLTTFFTSLLQDSGGMEVAVKIQSGYSYQVNAVLPRISLPISLMLPVSHVTSNQLGFLQNVADSVTSWIGSQSPIIDPTAQINFNIEVFSDQTVSSKPLFGVSNAYVYVAQLKMND